MDISNFKFLFCISSVEAMTFRIIFVLCPVNRLKKRWMWHARAASCVSKAHLSSPLLNGLLFPICVRALCEIWTRVYASPKIEHKCVAITALEPPLWQASVEFWSPSPAMPSAHTAHGNCRCHYLNLATKCAHVISVGSEVVFGYSVRIPPHPLCLFVSVLGIETQSLAHSRSQLCYWELQPGSDILFLRNKFSHVKLKVGGWTRSLFILSVRKH